MYDKEDNECKANIVHNNGTIHIQKNNVSTTLEEKNLKDNKKDWIDSSLLEAVEQELNKRGNKRKITLSPTNQKNIKSGFFLPGEKTPFFSSQTNIRDQISEISSKLGLIKNNALIIPPNNQHNKNKKEFIPQNFHEIDSPNKNNINNSNSQNFMNNQSNLIHLLNPIDDEEEELILRTRINELKRMKLGLKLKIERMNDKTENKMIDANNINYNGIFNIVPPSFLPYLGIKSGTMFLSGRYPLNIADHCYNPHNIITDEISENFALYLGYTPKQIVNQSQKFMTNYLSNKDIEYHSTNFLAVCRLPVNYIKARSFRKSSNGDFLCLETYNIIYNYNGKPAKFFSFINNIVVFKENEVTNTNPQFEYYD